MFETAELGRKTPKSEWRERAPVLRKELLEAQVRIRELGIPVVVLFAGVDGAGKGETTNLLSAWMDPHMLVTRAYEKPTKEERERPYFWRYWRDLPKRGEMGIFLSAWYSGPLLDRVYGRTSERAFDDRLDDIIAFERTLIRDGMLILKFWMHLSKKAQRTRFETLEADPHQKWRVTKRDWKNFKRYGTFIETAETAIARSSRGLAPWKIVEGVDHRYRSLTVATYILEGMKRQIAAVEGRRALKATSEEADSEGTETGALPEELVTTTTVLSGLDMTRSLEREDYREKLARYQARLSLLQRTARDRGVSTILVFEGWDAAGKGGAIRRLVSALDARDYHVISVAKPNDEELARQYLWRFWRQLPRAGRFTIFDRSWYGRVLVERIEGFATERAWRRAYGEINDFEAQLTGHATVLAKFWIHVTPEEQEKRFNIRREIPFKRWKLTPEDWRNRRRWSDYEVAVHDMVERTSTQIAPWNIVEGNDKRYARIKVIQTVCHALEKALELPHDDAAALDAEGHEG